MIRRMGHDWTVTLDGGVVEVWAPGALAPATTDYGPKGPDGGAPFGAIRAFVETSRQFGGEGGHDFQLYVCPCGEPVARDWWPPPPAFRCTRTGRFVELRRVVKDEVLAADATDALAVFRERGYLDAEDDAPCSPARGCRCNAGREAAERMERKRRHCAVPALARPGDWS